jgi:hypothetical protein
MAHKLVSALDRDIAASLAIDRVRKRWRTKLAAYQRAIAALETGSGELEPAERALTGMYKIIDEMAQHAPRSYADPETIALQAELDGRVKIADAQSRGLEARSHARSEEIRELKDQEREANRSIDWMRR